MEVQLYLAYIDYNGQYFSDFRSLFQKKNIICLK